MSLTKSLTKPNSQTSLLTHTIWSESYLSVWEGVWVPGYQQNIELRLWGGTGWSESSIREQIYLFVLLITCSSVMWILYIPGQQMWETLSRLSRENYISLSTTKPAERHMRSDGTDEPVHPGNLISLVFIRYTNEEAICHWLHTQRFANSAQICMLIWVFDCFVWLCFVSDSVMRLMTSLTRFLNV